MPDKRPRTLTPADLDDIRQIVREVVREEIQGYEPAAASEPPDEPDNP
jgi:hypothetical protein